MKKERKVGEIFEYNGEWYQCVKGGCYNCCDLLENGRCVSDFSLNGSCFSYPRKDKTNVLFKKLLKVGDPYKFDGHLFQSYRTFEVPIFTENYATVRELGNNSKISIEIKQNKENMKEKKDNYDGNMDKECIQICDALNSISDVRTTESCCGHCKDRFMIFLTCDNPHSLAIIARVFDRRYIGTSQPWYIELQTKDSGAYYYFIHSETKYSSEEVMMKDVNKIIKNIKYWGDDKFASHFRGCDDKPTLTPFDINLAKQGKPVCTRDGYKARIICFDAKGMHQPIIALITQDNGVEYIETYYSNGRFNDDINSQSGGDLMMLPEKKVGWVNVYKNQIHDTPESAKEGHKGITDYIKTIRVEWEE